MNLKLGFASLSLGASVDQQTGHLSVFDIVEEVRTPQLPIHLQSLVITLALVKLQEAEVRGKIMIHFLMPDGSQALVGNGEMAIPAEQRRMKAVFRFGGFPIQQFGEHRLVVSWLDNAGAKKGEAILDFDVVQVTQIAQGMDQGDKPPVSH